MIRIRRENTNLRLALEPYRDIVVRKRPICRFWNCFVIGPVSGIGFETSVLNLELNRFNSMLIKGLELIEELAI